MKYVSIVQKLLKLVLNQFQNLLVVVGRIAGIINFPVPQNSAMRKTSSNSIRHYYLSGIQTYLPIVSFALQKKVAFDQPIKVLDFGCGVGRQLHHFTSHFPRPAYFACDIDDTSIAFIADNYPKVETYVNSFSPPLKYPDEMFDMVYSVSIFSHLSMDDQKAWLEELARVTRPGGYCFLTVEGATALSSLSYAFGEDEATRSARLDECGWLYKEYEGLQEYLNNQNTLKITAQMVGVEGSYGSMVLSSAYIRENWDGDLFEVTDIIEGIIDHRQDLVVMRRK